MNNKNLSAGEFVRQILSVITNASLYGMQHPQVQRLQSVTFSTLRALLDQTPELPLMVIENELVVGGVPQEANQFQNRLIQVLNARGIGSITFLRGIGVRELDSLVVGLSRHASDCEMASSDHVRFGRVEARIGVKGATGGASEGRAARTMQVHDMPREELARFGEMYEAVRGRQKFKVDGILATVADFVEVFQKQGKSLLVMAALRDTDEYTFTHSTNVSILNIAQASALGIKGQLLNEIGVAGMLHDMGKLFIPEEVLTKAGRLSAEEFQLMKQHPVRGARYLLESPGVPRMASIVAFEHHAKFNLSGYPKLPAGWRLNLCSHLTMISDFFDALRTRRSYREPVELDKISEMMQSMMGTDLHPVLTRNFLRILSKLETLGKSGSARS